MIAVADIVAYGYLGVAMTGAVSLALSRRFPEQKWLGTVAKVCTTVAMHWGVIAAIASRPAPKPGESGPDIHKEISGLDKGNE